MLSVELHVIGGKHSGQVIKLNHKKFLIGREQDCHLRPNSELVSRHHCIFTVDDFSVRLRDLGSTNGTTVNGERLRKEVVLQPNDLVLVGNLEFKILINDGESAPEAPASKPLSQEETAIVGTETLAEMAPISAAAAMEAAAAEAQETTAPVPAEAAPVAEPAPAAEAAPVAEAPAAPAPQPAPMQMPQVGSGDTTIISTPMMMPGQPAYQPMMPQQMGYPPMYQGYPGYPPQMPGQMPMYPQGMPGQPAPGYPMQQQPQQAMPAPAAEPAAAPAPAAGDVPEVALPDPSQTGVKEAAPAAETPSGDGQPKPQEQKSNDSAAAIIQKHMQRRPGG